MSLGKLVKDYVQATARPLDEQDDSSLDNELPIHVPKKRATRRVPKDPLNVLLDRDVVNLVLNEANRRRVQRLPGGTIRAVMTELITAQLGKK